MCAGREERGRRGFAGSEIRRGAASRGGAAGVATCELCGSRASLYCRADDAFLCRKCDERVHGANFLARRHLRCFVCGACRTLTQRFLVGASLEVDVPTLLSWKDIRLSKRKSNIGKK